MNKGTTGVFPVFDVELCVVLQAKVAFFKQLTLIVLGRRCFLGKKELPCEDHRLPVNHHIEFKTGIYLRSHFFYFLVTILLAYGEIKPSCHYLHPEVVHSYLVGLSLLFLMATVVNRVSS